MKVHRFYVGSELKLAQSLWVKDKAFLHQWLNVLRFRAGQQIVLFDGQGTDRLYEITELNNSEVGLKLVTQLVPSKPNKDVYLLWSLLKKDKNDWVLQKATELGVGHFVPIISSRTEKIGFDLLRAQKIITEAAEQCGRSDIPSVVDPINLAKAIEKYNSVTTLVVCDIGGSDFKVTPESVGVLVGPEGGWTDEERQLFEEQELKRISVSQFTLRAETASVVAASSLLQ